MQGYILISNLQVADSLKVDFTDFARAVFCDFQGLLPLQQKIKMLSLRGYGYSIPSETSFMILGASFILTLNISISNLVIQFSKSLFTYYLFQLSKFVRKGLKADFDSTSDAKDRRYSKVLPIPDEGEKTILHLAAERDLVDIAKSYIKLYPNHVYEVTSGHGLRRIPLEFAIRNGHDETASYLAAKMMKSR